MFMIWYLVVLLDNCQLANKRRIIMATEALRFDAWPADIPRVGQIIQVHIAKDDIIEAVVAGRRCVDTGCYSDKAYQIWFDCPWSGDVLMLDIVPDASTRDRMDHINDLKPYWRIVPQIPGASSNERRGVKVFFLDEQEGE